VRGPRLARPPHQQAATCFLLGIVLFSGSLYGVVFLEARWLGAITPLGGLAFLAGWLLLATSVQKPAEATAQ
jgi:uncharacterized membrane protein YgdD (TMEM256/DUF423 family)